MSIKDYSDLDLDQHKTRRNMRLFFLACFFFILALILFFYFSANDSNSLNESLSSYSNSIMNNFELDNDEQKLPISVEEKWIYSNYLSNEVVEIPEIDESKPDLDYILQCGSFRNINSATYLQERLKKLGFDFNVESSLVDSSVWFRVFSNKHKSKRDLEKIKHKLSSDNIHGCQIKIW